MSYLFEPWNHSVLISATVDTLDEARELTTELSKIYGPGATYLDGERIVFKD